MGRIPYVVIFRPPGGDIFHIFLSSVSLQLETMQFFDQQGNVDTKGWFTEMAGFTSFLQLPKNQLKQFDDDKRISNEE